MDEALLNATEFLKRMEAPLMEYLRNALEQRMAFKFNIELFAEFIKIMDEDSESVVSIKSFNTKMHAILSANEIEPAFNNMTAQIVEKMEGFQEKDSGWALLRLTHCELNLNEFKPLRGTNFIPSPKYIAQKRACVNVRNKDIYCFKWSIISALYPVNTHLEKTSSYEIDDITDSVIVLKNGRIINFWGLDFPLKVKDISVFEELNPSISINLFGYDSEMKKIVGPYHLSKEEKVHHINLLLLQFGEKNHYIWIKDMSRLIREQQTSHCSKIFICNKCLQHFYSTEKLKSHENDCSKIVTKMVSPEKSTLEYRHFERQIDVPFVVYADFECLLQDIQSCQPDPASASTTTTLQEHIPCAFAYYIKCCYNSNLDRFRIYKGPDSPKKFINSLVSDLKWLYINHIQKPKSSNTLTLDEEKTQREATLCCIWYDCHLFVKELASIDGDISIIPINKELFMHSSLDALVNNLAHKDLKTVSGVYGDGEKFSLLTRKGVFPYEYINSWDRLNETSLPSREKFFNKMSNTECKEADYQHALNVWKQFNCGVMWDYLELYLKTDVLLLTDVFENFRNVCKNIYGLDPCQYYTTPGLSWDAMLKITSIKLELLTDIEMHHFVKRGIRGGITQCSHRHSTANNKYMKNYKEEDPSKYLIRFPMLNIVDFDVLNIAADSDIGYILEVDLEYPISKHDEHNDLPLCPENKIPHNSKTNKLIVDLTDKQKYVIHYRNLQQCIQNGLKLTRIYRILQFKQSSWLKEYIDLNTHYRKMSKNPFEKNFFKLLNNAVYGKTMENVDKRKDVKIVTDWESRGRHSGARVLISKPNFHSAAVFTPNMAAIQMDRVFTCYDKPIYLGFTVLDLSKLKMYDFHYHYMKPKYNDKLILNYMDTDSFIYTIETEDVYKDILSDIDTQFDTSEYAIDNIYNIPQKNAKVLGLMKDENNENDGFVKKAKGVKKIIMDGLSLDDYRDCLFRKKIFRECINKIALNYLDDKRFIREDGVRTYAWGHFNIRMDVN
ncbi:uncharacterized protein LOC119658218 [Hermetia illucens]|uniref:uncharacterized protein LOC119658218 n=1 Tax=Hermetia illucens TaxID=343691 RepID=UPI0018CC2B76|nr:uncharacterized protein LOC119658218 [Hermetia illucens]